MEKIEEVENRSNGRGEIDVNLLKYTFEPEDDRLSELTDIPLNQVNPLSWIVTFEEATDQLEDRMEYAAKLKAGEAVSKPKPKLLSQVWRKQYYKHRRSLDGSGKMMASTLAMKQLETQEANIDAGDQLLGKM